MSTILRGFDGSKIWLLTCVLLLFLTSETQIIEFANMMVEGIIINFQISPLSKKLLN
jgi:hypothetical protein